MALDLKSLDLEATTRDKVLFAAVAIPISGILGASLRVLGGVSETVTYLIVLPLLCAAFIAWHVGVAIKRARRAQADAEHAAWRPRDTHSPEYLQQRVHPRSR